MERDDLGLAQQQVAGDIAHPDRLQLGIGDKVAGQHRAAKAQPQAAGDQRPDLAGADHADGAAMEIAPDQPFEREIIVAHPRPGTRDAAIDRQHHADGELGDRVRRIGGHAHHLDAESPGRGEIDIVEPRAAQRDQLRILARQRLQHFGIDRVVDEDAYCPMPGRQRYGGGLEPGLEEVQVVAEGGVRLGQEAAIIGLGVEDGDTHGGTIP
jgi:hypothetical protein